MTPFEVEDNIIKNIIDSIKITPERWKFSSWDTLERDDLLVLHNSQFNGLMMEKTNNILF